MNKNQLDLFQRVLEDMEDNIQGNLSFFADNHQYDDAQECLNGLRHVGNILDNYGSPISNEDMIWVAEELFGKVRSTYDAGVGAIEECNEGLNICSDEDVKGLIDELLKYK